MAGFREHISVSTTLGLAYAVSGTIVAGFRPTEAALAGCLAGVAGMLPDLDSDTGRPVRELFGFVAAITPLFLVGRVLRLLELTPDSTTMMLAILVMYFLIRYGGAWFVNTFSVHRGMFHSIPAAVIAGEIAFLCFYSERTSVKFLMGGGVALGFFSHLLLDEIYSVEWSGVRVKLKSSAGSAVKLVSDNFGANVVTYALLGLLSFATLQDAGFLDDPAQKRKPPVQAVQPDLDRTRR